MKEEGFGCMQKSGAEPLYDYDSRICDWGRIYKRKGQG